MATKVETEGQAKQRHKLELREWQNQSKLLVKKWKKEKKGKKEMDEELHRMELDIKERHAAELQAFVKDEDEDNATPQPPSVEEVPVINTKLEKAQRKREKKKQEEKAREARIADEMKNVVSERQVEINAIAQQLKQLGMAISEIPSDGHCLYHAVADQLRRIDQLPSTSLAPYLYLRQLTASSLRSHKDDFLPFIELNYESDVPLDAQYDVYCQRVENSSDWGGQIELRALAQGLKRPIHVFSKASDVLVMGEEYESKGVVPLRVSYHLHYYSLGAHYNSVIPTVPRDEDESQL